MNIQTQNKNTFYNYDVVTDPDDPNIRQSLDDLLSLVDNNDKIVLNETNLDRGLVRYNIQTQYNRNKTPDKINKIDELISKISYVPITLSMDISKFDKPGAIITGIKTVIKALTKSILNISVTSIETVSRNNVVIFNLMDNDGAIYENPMYLSDYYAKVDLDLIGPYQVLSDDPVVFYVLEKLYKSNIYVQSDLNLIKINNILLIPVGLDNNQQNHYTDIINRVNSLITKYREDGYFSIKLGIHNLGDALFIEELAKLWDNEIVYNDNENIIINNTNDYGTNPNVWYQINIPIIKRGEFPKITLYGEWQFNVGGDYNEIYGKPWYQSIIHYAGLLAYRKLGLEDEFVQPFTHTVRVNNDLSITIQVPTYSHVHKFKQYLHDIIKGYYNLDSEHYWYAEPCKNLLDGVIKRWYIQSIDNKAIPMILKQEYPDGRFDNILVFRSPIVSHNLDLNNIDPDGLLTELRNYYRICHTGSEPVTLEDINNMELSELLNLIEVNENNGITYCYSSNTILSLDPPISPMTRNPLSDHIIIKAMLSEWGLRGLFNVGPLLGLYDDFPQKQLIEPRAGTPLINKEFINPIRHTITGDIYSVSIGFNDGSLTDLFEIATADKIELKRLVEDLWSSGFFLSYWTSAVQKYSEHLNSFPIVIVNNLLLYGSDSKADGARALNYLKISTDNMY